MAKLSFGNLIRESDQSGAQEPATRPSGLSFSGLIRETPSQQQRTPSSGPSFSDMIAETEEPEFQPSAYNSLNQQHYTPSRTRAPATTRSSAGLAEPAGGETPLPEPEPEPERPSTDVQFQDYINRQRDIVFEAEDKYGKDSPRYRIERDKIDKMIAQKGQSADIAIKGGEVERDMEIAERVYDPLKEGFRGLTLGIGGAALDKIEKEFAGPRMREQSQIERWNGSVANMIGSIVSGQAIASKLVGISKAKQLGAFKNLMLVRGGTASISAGTRALTDFAAGKLDGKTAASNVAQALVSTAIGVLPEQFIPPGLANFAGQVATEFATDLIIDVGIRDRLKDQNFASWFVNEELSQLVISVVLAGEDLKNKGDLKIQQGEIRKLGSDLKAKILGRAKTVTDAELQKAGGSVDPEPVEPKRDLTIESRADLKLMAQELGVNDKGSKNAIIERIEKAKTEIDAEIDYGVGAARAGELPGATGIRNQIVDKERAQLNLPPREPVLTRTHGMALDDANRMLDANPTAARELVDSLGAKPRPLNDTEDALLTIEQVQRQHDFNKAASATVSATSNSARHAAEVEMEAARDALFDIYTAGQRSGTENARGLAARRMMMREDFSLAQMEVHARIANQGNKLSGQQKESTKRHSETIQKRMKAVDDFEDKRVEEGSQRVVKRLRSDKVEPRSKDSILSDLDKRKQTGKAPSQKLLEELARVHIRAGTTELVDLGIKLHADLKTIAPDMTARDIRVALSDYGKTSRPNQEQVEVTLRDLKAQSRMASQVEDVLTGKAPKMTGGVRDKMTAAQRAMTRDVRILMEQMGIHSKSDSDRLRTSMDVVKSRLRNQTEDIERMISSGERPVPRKGVAEDKEIRDLRKIRDEAREMMDEIDRQSGRMYERNATRVAAQLDKRIAAYLVRIEKAEIGGTRKTKSIYSPEIGTKQKQLAELREAFKEFRKEAAKPAMTPDAKALAQLKGRLKRQTEQYERRLAEGDFEKKTPREIQQDEEAMNLRIRADAAKADWQEAQVKWKMDNLTPAQRAFYEVKNTFAAIKALKTSYDLSGVRRQGGWYMATHPIKTFKTLPLIKQAIANKNIEFIESERIAQRPNAALYKKAGLGITSSRGNAAQMADEYMVQKSFAGKALDFAPGVRASERAYNVYLNRIRADYFDLMASKLSSGGKALSNQEYKDIANFVNDATGRAGMGSHDLAAQSLAQAFWSPRFVLSRFKLISGYSMWSKSPRVRAQITKEYVRMGVALSAFYGLLSASGVEIEADPRSSNFGKFRIGKNTWIDPLSGFSQATVFIAKMVTGQRKTQKGEIVAERGEDVPYGGMTTSGTIGRFVRSKLAPIPGSTFNLFAGEDYKGDPTTLKNEIMQLPIPLALKDAYEAMIAEGMPVGAAASMLAIMGEGVNTIEQRERSSKKSRTRRKRSRRRTR